MKSNMLQSYSAISLSFLFGFIFSAISLSANNAFNDSLSQIAIVELKQELDTTQNDTARFKLYIDIGASFLNNVPDSAYYYYNQALNLSKELNRQDYVALSYSNIGSVYWSNGNLDKAIEYVLTSTKIYENLGDRKGMAGSYGNISTLYSNTRNFPKALEFLHKALKIYEELGIKKEIVSCYNNLGKIYLDTHDKKALRVFLKCKVMSEEINDDFLLSHAYNNIGVAFLQQKQYDNALAYLHQSVTMFDKLADKNGMASAYKSIADIYIEQKKYSDAISYAAKSLTIGKKLGSLTAQYFACSSLYNAYEKKKDYENAFLYYKLFKEIGDSIVSKEGVKQLFEFQAQFDVEQKVNEIRLLKKDNEIITLAYEKQKIFRNFLIIGSLLLIVIAVVVFLLLTEKKRANAVLVNRNSLISQQSQKLSMALQQLEDQKNNLEVIVNQRTEELRLAKNLAEESNEFKSAILRNISHEIRTPLNAIMGFSLFLCEEGLQTEDKEQYVKLIEKGTSELTNVIENLIEISSLEAQDYVLTEVEFSLYDLISNIVREVMERLKPGVQLVCESESLEQMIVSDKGKLKNIVLQVLSNAVNYTESGIIRVVGKIENSKNIDIPSVFGFNLREGDYLVLEIEDSGIGIPEDQQLKVYNTFHKIETPKTILFRGMGLGLSISKRLVEIMNGAIYHISKPEKGTKFFIVVPFEKC